VKPTQYLFCVSPTRSTTTVKLPLDVAIVKLLSSGANVPVVYAGKVIEDAGKWFNGAGNWFGDRAADYSKVLGNTAMINTTFSEQIPNFNSKIVERGKMDTSNAHYMDRSQDLRNVNFLLIKKCAL
jgi:hypothetical protein